MSRKTKNLILNLLCIIFLLAVFAFQIDLIFIEGTREEKPPFEKGEILPDFSAQTIDGQIIQLSEEIKQKETLLVFFSPYSAPCRRQIEEILFYLKEQSEPLFNLILISDESKKSLQKFKSEFNTKFPIIYDPDDKIFQKYNIKFVPTSLLLDKNRKLLYAQVGGEGFSVFKIQALLKYKTKKFVIPERE